MYLDFNANNIYQFLQKFYKTACIIDYQVRFHILFI